MKGRLLLDIVIRKGATVFELLACEDQALLVWRNTAMKISELYEAHIERNSPLLVLNLLFNIIDGVRGLDLESDGLAGEGLDEDLHDVQLVQRE